MTMKQGQQNKEEGISQALSQFQNFRTAVDID